MRITLNLSYFYQNHKSVARLYINEAFKTVHDLEQHISTIFQIENFYLSCDNNYLPPSENIKILQNEDVVWVRPNFPNHVETVHNNQQLQDVSCEIQEVKKPSSMKKRKKKNISLSPLRPPSPVVFDTTNDEIAEIRDEIQESVKKRKKKRKPSDTENVEKRKRPIQNVFGDDDSGQKPSNIGQVNIVKTVIITNGNSVRNDGTSDTLKDTSPENNCGLDGISKRKKCIQESSGVAAILGKLRNGSSNGDASGNSIDLASEKSTDQVNKTITDLDLSVDEHRNETELNCGNKRKRKRVRKRKPKTSMTSDDSLLCNGTKLTPVHHNTVPETPNSTHTHIRFTDESIIQISTIEDNYGICSTVDEKCATTEQATATSDNEGSGEVGSKLNEDLEFDYDLEFIEKLPAISTETVKVGRIIAFKIFRLAANYCPEISPYIIGKVIDFHSASLQMTIDILCGIEHCIEHLGKFSLEGEEETKAADNIINYYWENLIDPKLLL